MTGFGVFNILAAILQLVVPSYGLRLVRRFGAERVGWFLVVSFCSLAMVHFLKPLKPFGTGAGAGAALDVVCVLASGLLLIGMGHIETLFSERARLERERERRREEVARELQEQTAELTSANQELVQEIARRERREKALKESETQYRALFGDNPQAMWIFDLRTHRILAVNQAALRQYRFSREEFMGLTAQGLLAAESVNAFVQEVARPCGGAEARGVWRHCRKDRSEFDAEITAVDLKFGELPARLVVAQDISLRRKREAESRESAKMETIGRMAGGVAHHFNNLLTIIDGRTNLVLREPLDAKTREHLEQVAAAAGRAAGLTRQLLAVSARHVSQPELVDVNGLLRKLSPVVRRLVGSEIMLQENYAEQLPAILADPHLLEPMIINLVLNARDAMSAGGQLTLTSGLARLEANEAQAGGVEAGEFVRLSVRDTGCGMTPEVQAHVFEPFFTTRDVGHGTGLGVASVYGTVKQHGGWVEYSTEPGIGTEFRVFLPRASTQQSQAAASVFRETILLVEPDERARAVARYFLSRSGYRVIEVDSAATALGLWEGQGPKVDLLLVNLNLPGNISGPELAERLRQTRPELKVAYSVEPGASSEAGQQQGSSEGRELVAQPFTPEGLLQAVQRCLNG
jgi:PAS domain S-box-containing protein